MTEIDRELFAWEKATFGNGPKPEWRVQKEMYAEHLAATKTKTQIWKMLCGAATGPCHCKCPCPQGLAWNKLLAKREGSQT